MTFEAPLRWDVLTRTLVAPHIQSFDQYLAAVREGHRIAEGFLQNCETPIPPTTAIAGAHSLIFWQVYKAPDGLAGKYRTPVIGLEYETPPVGLSGERAFATRIVPELNNLHRVTKTNLAAANTAESRALVVAQYHTQFVRICPFYHGTAFLGLVLAQTQCSRWLHKQSMMTRDVAAYETGLREADRGDYRPLALALTGVEPRERAPKEAPPPLFPALIEARGSDGKKDFVDCRDMAAAYRAHEKGLAAEREASKREARNRDKERER